MKENRKHYDTNLSLASGGSKVVWMSDGGARLEGYGTAAGRRGRVLEEEEQGRRLGQFPAPRGSRVNWLLLLKIQ